MAMPQDKPNASAEIKALWNSLPRSRRIVAIVCSLGWVACIAAMVFAYKLGADFPVALALVFLFFLFLDHSKYALEVTLTQRRVREIDYWYLGAATIGLFLAVLAYSTQRNEAVFRFSHKLYDTGEQSRIAAVKEDVSSLTKFLCVDMKTAKEACAALKHVVAEIRPGLSAAQIAAIHDELLQKVGVAYAKVLPADVYKDKNSMLPIVVAAVKLDEWRDFALLAPEIASKSPKADEETEIFFSFGQWVIWPFLLVFALALRITKVTIDVFEWAK
jgi:hypothetical protein